MSDFDQTTADALAAVLAKTRRAPAAPAAPPDTAEYLRAECGAPRRHAAVVARMDGPWGAKLAALIPRLGTGCILVLHGINGNGKTQLGVELMRHQVGVRKLSAKFTSSMEFFMAVKATYRPDAKKDEAAVVAEFTAPKLLVMDEVEKRGESEWENHLLFHLVNRRYNDGKDTVMISNLDKAELPAHLGRSLVSRLNQTGGLVFCDWPSKR